jgi:hypothetical protein
MGNAENELLVVPSGLAQDRDAKGLIDGARVPIKLNVGLMKENLSAFVTSINELLSGIPEGALPFKLDEIELTFEVNAEGGIQLIGGVKVGASGGITLRMKR